MTGPVSPNTGRRLITVGALVGLAPACALGTLLLVRFDAAEGGANLLARISLFLYYASPYLLALVLSRSPAPQTRGLLVFALSLLSLAAVLTSLSMATLLLLPSIFLLLLGAVETLRRHRQGATSFIPQFIAGLAGAATIWVSFFALFWVDGTVEQGKTTASYGQSIAALGCLALGATLFLVAPRLRHTHP